VFEKVQIVKPLASRAVNSERYLVAQRLCDKEPFLSDFITRLDEAMTACTEKESVTTLFSLDLMHSDSEFVQGLQTLTLQLCMEQTAALKTVLDSVEVENATTSGRLCAKRLRVG